jgi:hypothetical protein
VSAEFREPQVRLYPTRAPLPAWGGPLVTALSSLRVEEAEVRHVSPEFSIRGLMKSPYRPDLKVTLNPAELHESVKAIAPIDGAQVVEWMHHATVNNVVLQARAAEYNALGSQLVATSGDAYIPGVTVEDIQFQSIMGSEVASRGSATVITPAGTYDVPVGGKATGIYPSLLTWGSIPHRESVQWVGVLMKWKELASTPIRQSVGFYMDSAGNSAPLFFLQRTSRPKVRAVVKMGFQSSDDQVILINFRNPNDYTKVVASRRASVKAGSSEVSFAMFGIPFVPPLVAEIQPQNNVQCILTEYVVR